MKYNPRTREYEFWASGLPRGFICPASGAESAGKPDLGGEPGALGSAVHEFFEKATKIGSENVNLDAFSMKFVVDRRELQDLCYGSSWDPRESGGEAEVRYEWKFNRKEPHRTKPYKGKLVARLDYRVIEKDGVVNFIDYKTTRLIDEDPEPQHDPQLIAGMLAVFYTHEWKDGERRVVRSTKWYVRRGDNGWSPSFEITEYNAEQYTDALFAALDAMVAQWRTRKNERRYRVSKHCNYCPGQKGCQGRRLALDRALSGVKSWFPPTKKIDKVSGLPIPSLRRKTEWNQEIDTENVHQLKDLAGMLQRSADAINKSVKKFVHEVGPIPDMQSGGDKVLAFKTTLRRKNITPEAVGAAAVEAGISHEAAAKLLGALEVAHPLQPVEKLESMDETKLAQIEAREQ